jgi:hypothetical protein
MKRKTLTTAIMAGLTGVAGMIGTASAVNVNPDGLGQVLLYPYYSARAGNQTLISVVNTNSNGKAVKIRFLDALNSEEVLDFNIYMSEFDVWVAAITDLPVDDPDGTADLLVPDTTCTSPYLFDPETEFADQGEQEFLTFLVEDADRTLSGHIEIIEMGTLVDTEIADPISGGDFIPETWARHIDNPDYVPGDPASPPRRIPANCDAINDAWSTIAGVDGQWRVDPTAGIDPASGGLYGGGSVINVDDGTMFSYNATAVDAFFTATGSLHTDPGNVEPDLTGDPVLGETQTVSNIFVDGNVQTSNWATGGGVDAGLGTLLAVNATITRETVLNEYVFGGDANANTEWLLTFPSKFFHVNGEDAPVPPFTSTFGADGACEEVFFARNLYDREEDTTAPGSEGPIVSPPPPPGEEEDFELCFESQVVRFGPEDDLGDASEIFKEPADRIVNIEPQDPFRAGWVRFSFNPINVDGEPVVGSEVHESLPSDEGEIYQGLPVIGFAVTRYTNGTLVDDSGASVLANYAGAMDHRGTRRITVASPQ